MKKCSTLFYMVDNRSLISSQIVNIDAFNEDFDEVLHRFFVNFELTVSPKLVQKTLKRIKGI